MKVGNPIRVTAAPAQMNETDVIEALDQSCQGLGLIFQVVQDAETLYVYVNRPKAGQSFSYASLTQRVQRAIAAYQNSAALQIPQVHTLHLYSRELGTVEPDWETSIAIACAEIETLETLPEAVVAVPEPDALAPENLKVDEPETLEIDSEIGAADLSHYCFTRNHALLTAEILPPTEKIAYLVQSFHLLPFLDKLSALTHVEGFFRGISPPALEDSTVEAQAWLQQLQQIEPADLRKTAIWMSRYCLNPEAAMSQVAVVVPQPEATASTVNPQPATPQSLVQMMLATPAKPSLEMYSAAAPARPRAVSPPQPSLQSAPPPPLATVKKTRPRFFGMSI